MDQRTEKPPNLASNGSGRRVVFGSHELFVQWTPLRLPLQLAKMSQGMQGERGSHETVFQRKSQACRVGRLRSRRPRGFGGRARVSWQPRAGGFAFRTLGEQL